MFIWSRNKTVYIPSPSFVLSHYFCILVVIKTWWISKCFVWCICLLTSHFLHLVFCECFFKHQTQCVALPRRSSRDAAGWRYAAYIASPRQKLHFDPRLTTKSQSWKDVDVVFCVAGIAWRAAKLLEHTSQKVGHMLSAGSAVRCAPLEVRFTVRQWNISWVLSSLSLRDVEPVGQKCIYLVTI